jgi:integrase
MRDRYVLPHLGGRPLREVDVMAVQRLRADLEAAGVGAGAVSKTLVLLSSVLQSAVEWGRVPSSPVRAVRKPTQRRGKAVQPLTPAQVEAILANLLTEGRLRDATLISVMAYAGVRPGEAMALTWQHVRERTLLVEQAAALGEVRSTKTGATRTVPLIEPLAEDLQPWRNLTGAGGTALVFRSSRGDVWNAEDWRNCGGATSSPPPTPPA